MAMHTIRSFKTGIALVVAALVAALLYTASPVGSEAWANFPSGKSTVAVSDVTLIEDTAGQTWTTVLDSQIKPPGGNRALFIDVSLECGLYTQTQVKSKGGQQDTSTAEATVTVRTLITDPAGNTVTFSPNYDGAYPGEVTFCNRYQELSAELQGMVDLVDGELVVTDYETIELIQRTMSANAFNFVAHGLDSGIVYDIKVQALVDTDTTAQNGSSSAVGSVGKGSVTVDAVRLVRGDEVLTTE